MDNNIDKNILRDERIDAYFRGKMTTEEESQFMKDVAADGDLRQKVVALARLAKGMKEVGEEHDNLVKQALKGTTQEKTKKIVARAIGNESIEEYSERTRNLAKYSLVKPEQEKMLEEVLEMEKEGKTSEELSIFNILTEEPKKRKWPLFVSIAASVAIIVGVGVTFLQRPSTVELGEQYYMAFESSTIRGSEDANITRQIEPLFENVKQGEDLDKAISELAKLWTQASKDEYNDYTDYAPEIGWNLTIAYLKNNDKKHARIVLRKLISSYGQENEFTKQAKELLDKIED